MKKIKKTLAFVSAGLSQSSHYSVSSLKRRGYKFLRMESNRLIPDLAVNKLSKSIILAQAVLQPILVIAAQAVADAGVDLYDEDGAKVDSTTTDLDKMLCVVDGQTRLKSYISICGDKSIDSSKITCSCAFPQTDNVDVAEILSMVAGTVRPWSSLDHLQSLIVSWKDEPTLDLAKVKWICQLANGGASETAALYWGNFAKTRTTSKVQYRSATKVEGDKYEKHKAAMAKIAEPRDYKYGFKLYTLLRKAFIAEYLGVYCIPAFFIDKMASLQADGMGKEEAYEEITSFAESFNADMAKRVADALGAGARKKDTETRMVLEDLYVKFKGTKK